MAIDLPPPPSPVQTEVSALQGRSTLYDGQLGNLAVHIVGDTALALLDFTGPIQRSKTASDVVRAVAQHVYRAGYPAAEISYASTEDTLFVGVTLAHVAAVEMPAPVARYFEDLPDQVGALTDAQFERRRALASLHADMASLSMQPKFEPTGQAGEMRLIADASDTEDDASSLHAEIGNPGNRFVGRHYVDASVSAGLASGDRFVASTRDSLSALNSDEEDTGELHERRLDWRHVSTWGLFGLNTRYLSYDFSAVLEQDDGFNLSDLLPFLPGPDDPEASRINGRIFTLEAYWQTLLYADFYRRWTVQVQIDRTGKTLDTEDDSARIQREIYNSVELSTNYGGSLLIGEDSELGYEAELKLRHGIGNDDEPLSAADLNYFLWQPSLEGSYARGAHWFYSLRADMQFSSDIVPEQQQWVLGGRDSLDAYLPGVAVGDEGASLRAEVAYEGVEMLGMTWRPRLFADYAYSHSRRDDDDVTLADAGIGLDIEYRERIKAALSFAQGIHDDGVDHQRLEQAEADVYFGVGVTF